MKSLKWFLIAVALLVMISAAAFALWSYQMNTAEKQLLDSFSSQYPSLANQPVLREIQIVNYVAQSSTQLAAYGVEIRVPWVGLVQKSERPGIGTKFSFPQNRFIIIFDDDYNFKVAVNGASGVLTNKDSQDIASFFGQAFLSPNYNCLLRRICGSVTE